MRRTIIAIMACLAWGGVAAAQVWTFQGSPAEGWTGATACVPGRDGHLTALCLSLGCTTGRGPGATLSVSEAALPPEVEATVAVDGEVSGVLDFRPDGSGITWSAPLDEQDRLVEALRTGGLGEIRLDFAGGRIAHPLSLVGAGEAIGAMLAACASPGGEAGETSPDPAASASAELEADCDGTARAKPGFVRQIDVDGDGVNDAILNWGGLRCSPFGRQP